MSALSSLWQKLAHSKSYRESFPAAIVKRMLPLQIRVLRKQRNWSQARLAEEAKLTQGVISRAEDPDYGNLTINSLVRVAAGFDCAFIGRFVPFSELGKWYTGIEDEKELEVPSFEEEPSPVELEVSVQRKQAARETRFDIMDVAGEMSLSVFPGGASGADSALCVKNYRLNVGTKNTAKPFEEDVAYVAGKPA